jgi:hypothetical protein
MCFPFSPFSRVYSRLISLFSSFGPGISGTAVHDASDNITRCFPCSLIFPFFPILDDFPLSQALAKLQLSERPIGGAVLRVRIER